MGQPIDTTFRLLGVTPLYNMIQYKDYGSDTGCWLY